MYRVTTVLHINYPCLCHLHFQILIEESEYIYIFRSPSCHTQYTLGPGFDGEIIGHIEIPTSY